MAGIRDSAIVLSSAGCRSKKKSRLKSALNKMPLSPKSLPQEECDHLGVLFKSGRYLELEDRTRVLLERFPDSGLVWKALGASLQMQGKEAQPFLQKAAELLPDDAAAQCNLGGELRSLGQLDAAISRFHRALEIRPDFAEAHNNLGGALQDLGQAKEAVASYRRAVQINPKFAVAYNNLGVSLHHLGQPADAVASFRRALEIDPDFADAHCNLAGALGDIGQWADAAASYRRALEIKPDLVVAHNRLGVALRNLGQADAAAASHRRALEIDPGHVSSHNNLGVALRDLGQLDAALASCRRALELDPDFVPALNNLGVALEDRWQLDDAVACFRRALQLDLDSTAMRSSLLSLQLYLVGASAQSFLAETRQFGDLVARQASAFTDWANTPDPERCLRIGFVSPDFRTHPVGYFIESILAALRSSAAGRLEISAYMTNSHTDAVTDRIRSRCHAWHSVLGVSDENLARQIRADGIDVLIDLSGHTFGNRLPLFAWKPAPVQVSWLGYLATTGLAAMDYIIADPWALPEAEEAHFTEKIWRLPDTRLCFTAPDLDIQVAVLPASVSGHITFGCFHYQNKINDAVIALWARVLKAVPGSRLFLKTKQFGIADVRQRITDRFAANGIEADRLIFEGSSPRVEYLATYHRVDIALDPFPFPGGTTTAESLWMGVPVLTLAGERFHERQGVGLLMNAGLPDWIAADENDYVARAVSHAGDLPRLAALRKGLRQKVLDSPLFDAPRFARHFESALRSMWQAWCLEQRVPHVRKKLPQVDADQLIDMFNAGQYAELEDRTRSLIEQNPDSGVACKFLGASLHVQGKDALPALQRAAELLPDDAEVHNSLGNVLMALGRNDEAMASYRRALAIKHDFADAHSNLGVVLHKLGRLEEAVSSYRQALEINPELAGAHSNLGVSLLGLGLADAAVVSHRRAVEIAPDIANAHYNLGIALRVLGQFDGAATSFRQALEISPAYAEAQLNLGNVLNEVGQLDNALASYRQALAMKPDFVEAQCNLLFTLNYLPGQSAETIMAQARRYGDMVRRRARPFTDWPNISTPGRALRVGLVSGDFRDHPVGRFVEGVLSELSLNASERLTLVAYSNHPLIDELTERIKSHCHIWRPVVGLSDENLARLIRADGIDILIDLAGHTAHNRLPVFAWKPAPVEVSWLGYFATTGLVAMDYLVADSWTLPEAEETNFTEKIWRLPETRLCFTPPDSDIYVAPLPALANGHITFGCFQNPNKISDVVVDLWARVMRTVPGSRLLLKGQQFGETRAMQAVMDRFAARGIDAGSLIFEGSSPHAEYLAAYHRVDISLDTFPFPGGTTTVESLWMGVPVLTLAGTSFLSRQGSGLLINAGLPDWIATDADNYLARAVAHASDLPRLAALRQGLRQQVLNSPLFEAQRFAGHFEAALRGMWQKWCAGQASKTNQQTEAHPMKTFLHVGCGSSYKDKTTRGFNTPEWNELRLDINEAVNPDIVGTMLDMSALAGGAVDALFSSHNIEHLYAHEVPLALAEFRRVLKPDGFAVITCPDLQSVCQLIAEDKLTEPAYMSPAGPIAPLDILYGLRSSLQQGNLYMAHRCGFTERVLVGVLQEAGFCGVVSGSRGHPFYDLWAVASKAAQSQGELDLLAEAHFPE